MTLLMQLLLAGAVPLVIGLMWWQDRGRRC